MMIFGCQSDLLAASEFSDFQDLRTRNWVERASEVGMQITFGRIRRKNIAYQFLNDAQRGWERACCGWLLVILVFHF